ncbi:ATP/GTP-binding protein [Kocuria sp. NPDC057446]|uniref:ATP/GTP-binding protein n=1 Tax=Kocuria sp. NPDC057446 TaxID=3346137 RepID=UPI0036A40CF5
MPRSNHSSRRRHGGAGPRASKWQRGAVQEPWSVERVLEPAPTVERSADGDWLVRHVRPANAVKTYTCPGCGRSIPPGIAHLVVWQQDSLLGARSAFEDRRHWHERCWRTRR